MTPRQLARQRVFIVEGSSHAGQKCLIIFPLFNFLPNPKPKTFRTLVCSPHNASNPENCTLLVTIIDK